MRGHETQEPDMKTQHKMTKKAACETVQVKSSHDHQDGTVGDGLMSGSHGLRQQQVSWMILTLLQTWNLATLWCGMHHVILPRYPLLHRLLRSGWGWFFNMVCHNKYQLLIWARCCNACADTLELRCFDSPVIWVICLEVHGARDHKLVLKYSRPKLEAYL
jgi:hypothetical protein